MVYDLLQVFTSNEKDYIPPGGPEISSLIIIDRGKGLRFYRHHLCYKNADYLALDTWSDQKQQGHCVYYWTRH